MFKNYLKTALRSLWNQKSSSLINLGGLSLGIAASLVLFLMIRHLGTFDDYHVNRDRIYRVVTQEAGNTGNNYIAGVPSVLPDAFRIDFPEAEEVTFISYNGSGVIIVPQRAGDPKKYSENKGICFGEGNFFKIFDRKILHGTAEKGLDEPNEVILSKKAALRYFGKEDPIGEIIRYDDQEYKVSAVMEDYPSNTDLPLDVIMSFVTIKNKRQEAGWHSTWSAEQCYFLLRKGESIGKVDARLAEFAKKHTGADAKKVFVAQPFSTVHFDERYGNYNSNTVSKDMLSILAVIALFLILTACINFINLSTAEAIKRSKEVGIRKSLGSTRGQLIRQFLGESALVTVVSMFLGLGLAAFAISLLNPFLDLPLALNFLTDGGLWLFVVGVTVAVTFLSGIYPSLVVSGFNPIHALKNKLGNRSASGFNLRRGLVILQFFISQFFIIGTIVLISQMNYFRSKDLGFKKDAIITVPLAVGANAASAEEGNRMHALKNEVAAINGVELASLSNTPPSSGNVSGTNFKIAGTDRDFETQVKTVDSNYLPLYDLELVAGENLPESDTARGFIVNQKLVGMAGFETPQQMIGVKLTIWKKTLPVVGVVKDFHTVSLHQNIDATVMLSRIKNYQTLSLKINPAQFQESIKKIQSIWEATYPEAIFSYQFIEDEIRQFYEREEKMSVLLTIFTSMAIFIGCLGLFGLASFMANQKTKEIGVRKVLGASVESIMLMFSREYLTLIGVAFVLSSPLAWYAMNQWLDGFAYKITMGPIIFITGFGVTLLLALLTVGYRSFRAASVNPAQSLKSE